MSGVCQPRPSKAGGLKDRSHQVAKYWWYDSGHIPPHVFDINEYTNIYIHPFIFTNSLIVAIYMNINHEYTNL